jgi:hypothetical protein
MSCCGQKRAQQRAMLSAFVHKLAAPRTSAGRFPMGRAYFEYIGKTAITVVGSVTNRQYRFATPCVPVVVDARDRWSLARVPLLREVR